MKYPNRKVSEQGPGRCSKCMQPSTRVIVSDRLFLADWDGMFWVEHQCKPKGGK